MSQVGEEYALSLSKKSINDLIPIISSCDLYVGNDSFGQHVTAQSGIPSLVLLIDSQAAYSCYSKNHYQIILA